MPTEIGLGREISAVSIAVTVQRLVMEAGANRDFMPVHHDARVATAQGAPDMYVNTFFVAAMIERTIRAWAGPECRVLRIGPFRMTRFACVGRVLKCRGRIAAVEGSEVELEMSMEDDDGPTMSGRARVRLGQQRDR
jgi:acyl dehydratase